MTTPAVTEGQSEPVSGNAAVSTEPQSAEYEWTGDKNDLGRLAEEGYNTAQSDKTLAELAGRENITIADLRALPESKGISDEQLQKMWDEVNGMQVAPAPTAAETAAAVKRAWKAYNGEQEVTDFEKMTAAEFLKLQHEYTANGKQHRKSYDELVRNASLGHYNAERMQQLSAERQTAYENWKRFESQATQLEQDKQTFNVALSAALRGEYKPLQTLLDAYQNALGQAPAAPEGPRMIPAAEVEAERAGRQVYETTVLPAARDLAAQYGVSEKEVAEGILYLVEREPAEFMTPARLQQIIQGDIPAALQHMTANRAPAAAPAAAAAPDQAGEIARLQAEIAALKGSKATTHNAAVDAVHARRRAAPPAASTMPGGAGMESPNFDSAQGARDWLNNLGR